MTKSKKSTSLMEKALNQAIADGFHPYDKRNPDSPNSAVREAARRLGVDPRKIINALEDAAIDEDKNLFKEKDPHKDYIVALREAGLEISSDAASRRTMRKLVDEAVKLRATLKTIDKENLTAAEVREKIYNLSSHPPEIPKWMAALHTSKGSPGVPITIWSDWHYGEVVDKEQMSGRNEFNLKIGDHRIQSLVERTVDILKNHQVNPKYPGIVVCLGGDMFSGDDLHAELTDTNEAKTIATFSRLQGRLIWAIKRMADEIGPVFVPCVIGNHARTTQKPRFKLRVETNYEFLLYNQLELFFKNDPLYRDKVKFAITTESGVHFQVDKHRYYLAHGDVLGVKGGDGIIGAIGPIRRGSIKVAAAEASIGKPFDTIVMGHWHQYIPMKGIIVNGTLKGWDEYARLAMQAPYDAPSQALWFNHPEHGPVTHHKIMLDKSVEDPGTERRPSSPFPLRPRTGSALPSAEIINLKAA